MGTPAQLAQWFDAHIAGHRYDAGASVRFGPTLFDCSGATWSCLVHGGGLPASHVPTTSWTQARLLASVRGLGCPPGDALHHDGWLIFEGARCGQDGFGPTGHVALTTGDGRTVREAQGHTRGCGRFSALGRNWVAAGPFPGIQYGHQPPPPPPPLPPADWEDIIRAVKHLRRQAFDSVGRISAPVLKFGDGIPGGSEQVRLWQNGMNIAIGAKLALDGQFGHATMYATGLVQSAAHRGPQVVTGVADRFTRDVCRYLLAVAGME